MGLVDMQASYVTQIGYPPLRIDILNTIDGVKFEDAFPNKLLVDVNGIEEKYIGLNSLPPIVAISPKKHKIWFRTWPVFCSRKT